MHVGANRPEDLFVPILGIWKLRLQVFQRPAAEVNYI